MSEYIFDDVGAADNPDKSAAFDDGYSPEMIVYETVANVKQTVARGKADYLFSHYLLNCTGFRLI